MRKLLLASLSALLLLLAAASAPAQKFAVKPLQFDDIQAQTLDPQSPYYFPKLLKSFQSNDTTLSFDGYRYLYYGYVFQEDYNPFRESAYSDMIESLYYNKEFTRAQCDTIEKYAELSLDDNIFDLQQMEYYIFALKEKRKNARAAIRQFRLNHIIAAILSSGSGSKEAPWVVTSATHEYYILNKLGYIATNHKSLDGDIDYIAVQKKNERSPDGFYFDASRIMDVAKVKFAE